jgi:hypothetical protein
MKKFLSLTGLNALDPLPALGRKVEFKPKQANPALHPSEIFERVPHELYPQRPGSAAITGAAHSNPQRLAQCYDPASSSFTRAKLQRPVVPYGDQRDSREGCQQVAHQGGHGAAGQADPRDPWPGSFGGWVNLDFAQLEKRFFSQGQTWAETEARRAGAAGSAVTGPAHP